MHVRTIPAGLVVLLVAAVGCQRAPLGESPEGEEARVCAPSGATPADIDDEEAERQLQALLLAFEQQSAAGLTGFLDNWSRRIGPVSCDVFEAKPEAEREAYHLYRSYYDPYHLARYGNTEWGYEINGGFRYVIIQRRLLVYPEGAGGSEKAFEVQDFRPALDFGWATHLYLTPRYEDILDRFLSPELDQDTLWARAWFLRSQLPLYPGHWGGWLFETAPTVNAIEFEGWRLPAATVRFSIVYEGGESRMLKVDGEWTMTESDLTWIM